MYEHATMVTRETSMIHKRSVRSILLLALLLPIIAACGGGGGGASTAPSTGASTSASSGAGGSASASPSDAEESEEASASASASGGASALASASGAASASASGSGAAAPSGGINIDDPAAVGPELAAALNGEYEGTTVTLFGPFSGEDEVKFNNSIKRFEEATGIDIQYEGTNTFESAINVRVEGGNLPDLVDFPQPGLLRSIAQGGQVKDIRTMVNPEWLTQNYNQSFIDIATVNSGDNETLGAIFHRVNGKSLVWYPKQAFDEAGYEVPETWDEMKTLMDDIVADGDTPWCIGIESGAATGWPATDWMEDIMLRTTSPENYDRWTTGELPFTDPIVKNAANVMSDIWFNDEYVYGGRQQIISTNFGDSPAGLFADPPNCYLHRQGNFITSFFETIEQGVEGGVDYDFFYLPQIDEQYGEPFLFAGDLMAAFSDRPEVRAVLQYWTTFDGIRDWVAAGGALSPHNDADASAYGNETDARIAELITNAEVLRFDGSDTMPGAVGAGTFWKGMTDWVSGATELDQAMEEIQAGWTNVNQ
jgi:alpha-glucoside transport system substrate-binding protein